MNKFLTLFLFIISFSVHAADAPSLESGRKIVEDKLKDSQCLSFVDFNKDDGQAMEYGGVKSYAMKYSATVMLKSGCYGAYSDKKRKFWSNPNTKYSKQGEDNMKGIGYRIVKEGEKVQISGEILYSKSEKGWSGKHAPTF